MFAFVRSDGQKRTATRVCGRRRLIGRVVEIFSLPIAFDFSLSSLTVMMGGDG